MKKQLRMSRVYLKSEVIIVHWNSNRNCNLEANAIVFVPRDCASAMISSVDSVPCLCPVSNASCFKLLDLNVANAYFLKVQRHPSASSEERYQQLPRIGAVCKIAYFK